MTALVTVVKALPTPVRRCHSSIDLRANSLRLVGVHSVRDRAVPYPATAHTGRRGLFRHTAVTGSPGRRHGSVTVTFAMARRPSSHNIAASSSTLCPVIGCAIWMFSVCADIDGCRRQTSALRTANKKCPGAPVAGDFPVHEVLIQVDQRRRGRADGLYRTSAQKGRRCRTLGRAGRRYRAGGRTLQDVGAAGWTLQGVGAGGQTLQGVRAAGQTLQDVARTLRGPALQDVGPGGLRQSRAVPCRAVTASTDAGVKWPPVEWLQSLAAHKRAVSRTLPVGADIRPRSGHTGHAWHRGGCCVAAPTTIPDTAHGGLFR